MGFCDLWCFYDSGLETGVFGDGVRQNLTGIWHSGWIFLFWVGVLEFDCTFCFDLNFCFRWSGVCLFLECFWAWILGNLWWFWARDCSVWVCMWRSFCGFWYFGFLFLDVCFGGLWISVFDFNFCLVKVGIFVSVGLKFDLGVTRALWFWVRRYDFCCWYKRNFLDYWFWSFLWLVKIWFVILRFAFISVCSYLEF